VISPARQRGPRSVDPDLEAIPPRTSVAGTPSGPATSPLFPEAAILDPLPAIRWAVCCSHPRRHTPSIPYWRHPVNKLSFKGEWNELKGKLKEKYAQLTDDDLMYEKGKEDQLLGRLQKKLGQKQDEIRKLIASL
jgi:uncharacterized protein YjbJ (UPF0337 family)